MNITKWCAAGIALMVLVSGADAQVTIDAFKDAGTFAAGFNDQGPPFVTENNMGSHVHVPVGRANNDRVNRSYFQFDIAGNVPAGSVVTEVTFEFDVTRQGGSPNGQTAADFSLHRVQAEWDEGTGSGNAGAPTMDGVTFTMGTPTTSWMNLGGDFDAATSGTVLVDGPTDGDPGGGNLPPITYSITSAKLISDVQNIVDGSAADYGFILKNVIEDETTLGSAARVGSREGGLPARLVILFGSGVILGDVNMDGSVNLLDVGPFVQLIADQEFQDEADINQDGFVNLLDVGPFVTLITGG